MQKTLLKRNGNDDNSVSKVPRLTRSIAQVDNSSSTTSSMFPDSCMIRKKKKIKVNGKEQHPKNILTFEAEKPLKKAAELKHDKEMVLAVNSVDLIAKELKNMTNVTVTTLE